MAGVSVPARWAVTGVASPKVHTGTTILTGVLVTLARHCNMQAHTLELLYLKEDVLCLLYSKVGCTVLIVLKSGMHFVYCTLSGMHCVNCA